jgi:hypothetical protein
MERLRTFAPSEDSPVETLHPLPGAPSLPELLAAVTSPGVLEEEVDALIRALALPLAGNEDPRARADFLLSVLETTQSSAPKGTGGRSLRVATVEALLSLGYPYALEVPPEALEEVERDRRENAPRDIPRAGIIAAVVAMLAQGLVFLPGAIDILNGRNTSLFFVLFMLGALWGPSLSALIGGWWRARWLQRLGLITMALMGTVWLSASALLTARSIFPWGYFLLSLTAGISLVGGAVLLRNPEWLAKEKPPPPPAQPA